jgi:hypothetical protein
MGYKKGPVGFMKSPMKNKAVGYMAKGSSAYMNSVTQMGHSPMKQLDKDGEKRYVLESEIEAATNGNREVSELGGNLQEVVLTAPRQKKSKKKKKKSYKEKYGTTRAGDALRGITRGVSDVGDFVGEKIQDINLYDNAVVRTIDNTIRKRPKARR